MFRWKTLLVLLTAVASSPAATVLTEGFDNIATLAGSGYVLTNNSNPVGTTGWFQGNASVFPAQAGVQPTSYIGADFNNTDALGGDISNWLLTPVLTLKNGDVLTFYTRTEANSPAPDRLEVRLSLSGASTDVGTTASSVGVFTNLLLSVNPSLALHGYPEAWTLETATVSGVAIPTSVRFGLRYFVTNTAAGNADYIGIDTLAVNTVLSTPEPSTAVFLILGCSVFLGFLKMRRASDFRD